MKRSGLADSPLFKINSENQPLVEDISNMTALDSNLEEPDQASIQSSDESRNRLTGQSTLNEFNPSRYHDIPSSYADDTMVELIRATVKHIGKEANTHRFSQAEKRSLNEIVHSFKIRGLRTSENELVRIAVNFLLEDYKVHRDGSMLSRCLDALHR